MNFFLFILFIQINENFSMIMMTMMMMMFSFQLCNTKRKRIKYCESSQKKTISILGYGIRKWVMFFFLLNLPFLSIFFLNKRMKERMKICKCQNQRESEEKKTSQ